MYLTNHGAPYYQRTAVEIDYNNSVITHNLTRVNEGRTCEPFSKLKMQGVYLVVEGEGGATAYKVTRHLSYELPLHTAVGRGQEEEVRRHEEVLTQNVTEKAGKKISPPLHVH